MNRRLIIESFDLILDKLNLKQFVLKRGLKDNEIKKLIERNYK